MAVKSALLACTLPLLTLGATAQTHTPTLDSYAVSQRQSVAVSPVEHAHLLTEMSAFMTAVNGITAALSKKDMATVASLASAMGPKGGEHNAVGKAVHAKLPPAWFELAKPTHQLFMGIAREAAQPQASVESVLPKLAATTAQCVACHTTFRLTVTP